jgi:hypothetical protein
MSVWIYVDSSKQVGDPEHLKVFANADAADKWFKDHDPEGVALEYPVVGSDKISPQEQARRAKDAQAAMTMGLDPARREATIQQYMKAYHVSREEALALLEAAGF